VRSARNGPYFRLRIGNLRLSPPFLFHPTPRTLHTTSIHINIPPAFRSLGCLTGLFPSHDHAHECFLTLLPSFSLQQLFTPAFLQIHKRIKISSTAARSTVTPAFQGDDPLHFCSRTLHDFVALKRLLSGNARFAFGPLHLLVPFARNSLQLPSLRLPSVQ
jgi:hypothetical protein